MHSDASRNRWPVTRVGRIVLTSALVSIGVLTMTPALALVDPAALGSYGVVDPAPPTLSLLQHRGVLQLALGAAIVWAAFDARVRVAILLGATLTKSAGVLLTVTRPEVYAVASGNVGLWFDLVCLVVLPTVAVLTLARGGIEEPSSPPPTGAAGVLQVHRTALVDHRSGPSGDAGGTVDPRS